MMHHPGPVGPKQVLCSQAARLGQGAGLRYYQHTIYSYTNLIQLTDTNWLTGGLYTLCQSVYITSDTFMNINLRLSANKLSVAKSTPQYSAHQPFQKYIYSLLYIYILFFIYYSWSEMLHLMCGSVMEMLTPAGPDQVCVCVVSWPGPGHQWPAYRDIWRHPRHNTTYNE